MSDEQEIEQHNEAFRIDGPSTADWALRKLRYYRKRDAEIEEMHRLETERIDQWAKDERGKLEGSIDYFEGLLTTWHMQVLAEDDKRKTLSYPNGKLKSTAGRDVLVVDDEEAFIAQAPDELVKIAKSVKKADTLKHMKETGEVLPGVRVEQSERSFKIEVSETAIEEGKDN